MDRRKIEGGAPHGYRFLKSPLSLGSRSVIGGEISRYRPSFRPDISCVRDMPNRDPEKVKEAKHRWYLKHREEIATRKQREHDTGAAGSQEEAPTTQTTQTAPDPRTACQSPRIKPVGL